MRPMLLDSSYHNHNRRFWFCSSWSYFAFKTNKKGPKQNDAKTFSLFVYVLQLVSCRPKPRFIFISREIRAKTERASYQAIDRPSDRSIERFNDFFSKLFFHLATHSGHPYNYLMQRPSD